MVLRNIVKIDEEKCDGCGQCVDACAEGAIGIVNGKAKLLSEIYCDGLGACIGHCPQDAITVQQRQADEFDETATKAHLKQKEDNFVCPSLKAQKLRQPEQSEQSGADSTSVPSQLTHWPVQLRLVSPQSPYFNDADLLLVADCVPFAMGDFHNKFLKNHSIVIGCPKLDDGQFYIAKLAQILEMSRVNSLTVIHMEVPCCSGLTHIAKEAIAESQTKVVCEDVTIDLRGNVIKTETIQ